MDQKKTSSTQNDVEIAVKVKKPAWLRELMNAAVGEMEGSAWSESNITMVEARVKEYEAWITKSADAFGKEADEKAEAIITLINRVEEAKGRARERTRRREANARQLRLYGGIVAGVLILILVLCLLITLRPAGSGTTQPAPAAPVTATAGLKNTPASQWTPTPIKPIVNGCVKRIDWAKMTVQYSDGTPPFNLRDKKIEPPGFDWQKYWVPTHANLCQGLVTTGTAPAE